MALQDVVGHVRAEVSVVEEAATFCLDHRKWHLAPGFVLLEDKRSMSWHQCSENW